MASGQLILIYKDGEKENSISYMRAALDNLRQVISDSFANANITFEDYFLSETEASQYGFVIPEGARMPRIYYVDLTKSGDTSDLIGYFPNQLRGFFYKALSNDHTPGGGNGTTGSGTGGYGLSLGNRDCNVVDKFLDWLHIGEIKQIVYGAGAAFLGYRAVTTTNQVGIALSGGMAAGLAYLALKSPDEACKIDLNKDGKTILLGAGVSVGVLAFYQFYLKDRLQEKRLTRIIRAAKDTPSVSTPKKTTTAGGRRRASKAKSVTVTKRY